MGGTLAGEAGDFNPNPCQSLWVQREGMKAHWGWGENGRSVGDRESSALFPLTLALPLRGREGCLARWERSGVAKTCPEES
jgi:hypothetical protein